MKSDCHNTFCHAILGHPHSQILKLVLPQLDEDHVDVKISS